MPLISFGQKKAAKKKKLSKKELALANDKLTYEIETNKLQIEKLTADRDSLNKIIATQKRKPATTATKPKTDAFAETVDCSKEIEAHKKEIARLKSLIPESAETVYDREVNTQRDWFRNEVNTKLAVSQNGQAAIHSERIPSFQTGFDVYVVDPSKNPKSVALYLKDNKGEGYRSLGKLNTSLKRKKQKLLFAMNGGMYRPDGMPQGLFIENGKEKAKIDLREDEYGNFYMMPNGVFFIDTFGMPNVVSSPNFANYRGSVRYATQSGPALVLDGTYNSHFNQWSKSRKVRNGVGVTRDNKLVFVISRGPVNLYDFATFFHKVLDCPNALYLDGVVSKMYCPALGRERSEDIGGHFGPIIGISEAMK